MTNGQKNLARYIFGSSGNCYHMTDYSKRCVVGMLQTGEIVESDFGAIHCGERWLAVIKAYAHGNGWSW